MRMQVALGAALGTAILGLLVYCSPATSVDPGSVDAGPSCDDAGSYCPCDPTKFTQATDCYSGPRGTNGKGVCVVGKRSCTVNPDGTGTTTACVGEVTPSPEICDYLDNDCDGITDNVPGIADAAVIAQCQSPACDMNESDASITCWSGTPYNACKAGRRVCASGRMLGCTNLDGILPQPEICNGWDDDCNDMVDDNPTDVGKCDVDPEAGAALPDGGPVTGECVHSTSTCPDGGLICPPSDPQPEKCDGLDNNCDGVIDNGACPTSADPWCCSFKSGSMIYGYCNPDNSYMSFGYKCYKSQ